MHPNVEEVTATTRRLKITIPEDIIKTEIRSVYDKISVGFGVFNPFGLGNQWPDDWEGRYIATDLIQQGHQLRCWHRPPSDRTGTESLEGSMFVINNPNATTTCGCGSSFSV